MAPKRQSKAYLGITGSPVDDGRGLPTPPGVPIKPDWIAAKPIASEKWDDVVSELQEIPGLLSTLDKDALSLYCDCWQTLHDAQALIVEHGMVCHSEKGGSYQAPAVGIANKARDQIIKLGSMYGLNPPAREGMIVKSPEDDEFADLLNGTGMYAKR